MYLVLSALTSSPISLVAATKASALSFRMCMRSFRLALQSWTELRIRTRLEVLGNNRYFCDRILPPHVNEIFVLLGCYSAYIGSWLKRPSKNCLYHRQGSSRSRRRKRFVEKRLRTIKYKTHDMFKADTLLSSAVLSIRVSAGNWNIEE